MIKIGEQIRKKFKKNHNNKLYKTNLLSILYNVININMNTNNADLKLPLIDLEADNTATGGKQELCSRQPERLSEGGDLKL